MEMQWSYRILTDYYIILFPDNTPLNKLLAK